MFGSDRIQFCEISQKRNSMIILLLERGHQGPLIHQCDINPKFWSNGGSMQRVRKHVVYKSSGGTMGNTSGGRSWNAITWFKLAVTSSDQVNHDIHDFSLIVCNAEVEFGTFLCTAAYCSFCK